ncbi:hypothetical protein JSCD4_36230 [Clostridioides difficile]|nr:hypothetical protein JSCD4_36230 [Clostridioides difficile]
MYNIMYFKLVFLLYTLVELRLSVRHDTCYNGLDVMRFYFFFFQAEDGIRDAA